MIGNPSVYSTTVSSPHSFPHLSADHHKTEESSEIRCICGFTHDDGFTIACDQCDTWQHGFCVDIAEDEVPDRYECPSCLPRPLDVRKATEYQKNRQDREEKSRRKKPKASTTNASRRKDVSNLAVHNNGPGPPLVQDRVGGSVKPPTPKETQPSRKRGNNRAAAPANPPIINSYFPEPTNGAFTHSVGLLTPNAPSPTQTVGTDRNVDGDSDTDMEKSNQTFMYDFTDITNKKDHYANKEVQMFVEAMASSVPDERRFSSEDIPARLPGVSVKPAFNSSSYSQSQRFIITLDTACREGQLVAICKGDIVFEQSYKHDGINQYSILRHPKPHVFFHPPTHICIDSRIHGSIARFAKRSCRPNTILDTLVVDGSEVMFGLFAAKPLEANAVLTIEWEWSGSQAIQRLVNGTELDQLDNEDYQDALNWVNQLVSDIGDCACVDKEECLFTKMRVKRESSTPKLFPTNSRTRRGSRAIQEYSSTPASDHFSPERQLGSDREDGHTSRKSSRSRDLSPSTLVHEEMSGREARKMQDIISRIEKFEQKEPVLNKRRKRNNTVSAATIATGEASVKVEVGRKNRNFSTAFSSPSAIPSKSVDVKPLHIPSRESSDSLSASSDDCKVDYTQMQPPPPPIKRIKKPDYVDSAMQTDDCEGAWWCPPPQEMKPRHSHISLKERLRQSMLREQENAAVEMESKKRKQSEMSDGCPSPTTTCKEQKVVKGSDVKSVTPNSPFPTTTTDIPLENKHAEFVSTPPQSQLETPLPSACKAEKNHSIEPIESRAKGPALADIFADSPPSSTPAGEHIVDVKRTPPISPRTTTVDEPHTPVSGCSFGLHVQLPTGPLFPTAPATPSPLPPLTTSPAPQTPGAQAQSPLTLSATALNFPPNLGANCNGSLLSPVSAPAKTKKLSLSEYGNRRKKVDHSGDRDKKMAMSVLSEESHGHGTGPTDASSPPTSSS
ncbi:hypothetical protein BDZ91DRAFT_260817 [Kalaharituber pfeilii]|nr:hypothetical protein BDZ91DRAFT_260817 [Kalaharituber pfeilii]